MEKIILNTNYVVTKVSFNIKMELAKSPYLSTTKFCWGKNRITVEHISENLWTVTAEDAATQEPLDSAYEISTGELSQFLDKYFD